MKTILYHLKQHKISILLVIISLFINAICDLSLPDYTAKIVDVGIRQNGIEDNVFEKIKEEDFKKIELFLSKEEKEKLLENYELNETYNLKNIDKEKRKELSKLLITPEITIQIIEGEYGKTILKSMNLETAEDLYKLIKHSESNEIKNKIEEQYKDIDDQLKMQFGIEYVKGIYKNLNTNMAKTQNNYIKTAGLKMLVLSLISAITIIVVSYLSSKISARFGASIRKEVVEKVMSFGNKEMKEIGTASLITRSTNDINRIQMTLTMSLRIAAFAPIMGIGALLKVIHNPLNFILIIGISLILMLVIILFTVVIPKFKILQNLVDRVNLVFRETLSGLPVIRAFANEKHEEERFDEANQNLKKTNLFVNRIMSLMMPTMNFIMNAICILIVYVGAKRIDLGTVQIGTLMAFIQYTMQIIISFLMISMMSIMIPRAIVSFKRIAEVLDKDPIIKEPEVIDDIGEKFKGNIEFKDVYFRYHDADEDILENISFKATPGTTTAIIGGTGSGKSTLINLIPRFFDVTGGEILIDGINVKKLDLYNLRENIGYVPQKGILFKGTIKENIAFGKNKIDKKKVEEAAKISQSEEFINEKKNKYDDEISQGGTNVSGGQKQRLSIARAIYKNPSIYIFDDSFSALDFKTDKNLRHELKTVTQNSTVLIVAQRISTVLNADQIIVLDEGKIVGIGKHEELMKTCEIYKEIALSQVTEEELNGK
jgi:ATP-binding cassette subfamily B protein